MREIIFRVGIAVEKCIQAATQLLLTDSILGLVNQIAFLTRILSVYDSSSQVPKTADVVFPYSCWYTRSEACRFT